MNYEVLIGLRYTRAKASEAGANRFISFISLTSMLGLALGVAALIVVLSVMNGFQKELRERILGVVSHIQINGESGQLASWQAVEESVRRHPRVQAAAPFVQEQGMVTMGGNVRGLMVRGILPEVEDTVADFSRHMTRGKLSELRAGEFGIVNGWSNFRDNNSGKAYLGALRYRTPGMDTWVDYEFITGDAQSDPSNLSADPASTASKVNIPVTRVFSSSGQKKTQHFLTVSHDWDEDWHAQLGLNFGEIKGDGAASTVDIITGPGFKGAKWHGVEARLQYKLNTQWSVAGRIEKFTDSNGFALFPNTTVAGDYNAVTIGAQWKPTAALLIRPELRYDWQSNNNGVNAFNGGKTDRQTSVNVDLIYQF